MNIAKNIKIREEYTLTQYKSSKYSIKAAPYDRFIVEKLIVGDDEYKPNHVIFFDSEKISQAYNDALKLDVNSENSILQYVNKYGLPVTDGDYDSLKENTNWLKHYIVGSKINTFYEPSDFYDQNSLFYTQKALSLLQAIVNLQKDLHNYYFYDNESSEPPIDNIICNIFHDLVRVMISLDHNCLCRSIERKANPNYGLNFNAIKNEMSIVFKSINDLTTEVLKYLDTVSCTNSSLFAYKLFQVLDFDSTSLTIEPLLKRLLFSGKDVIFSHGKITIPNHSNVLTDIDPSFNTKQTFLLLKISETAINICNKKETSLNKLFKQRPYEITFQDILDNYTHPSYGQDRKLEICNEIYTAAELFYFEIFTDLLVDCPPTVKLEKDIVIYSRQLPNLIQALFNKLYREAFIKYKVCAECGKPYPESSRRRDSIYCSDSCSARFRKRQNREIQEKRNKH